MVAVLIATGWFDADMVHEAGCRANRTIVASPGKDVSRRPEFCYRVMGSDLAPEISIGPDTMPGLLEGLRRDQG